MKKKHKILKFSNGSMIEFKGKHSGDKMYSCGDRFLICEAEPYTREEAIKEGILHDVTKEAQELNFILSVAISNPLWALINDIPARWKIDTINSRVIDILTMLKSSMLKLVSPWKPVLLFDTYLQTHCKNNIIRLKAILEKGDNFETVITISLPK